MTIQETPPVGDGQKTYKPLPTLADKSLFEHIVGSGQIVEWQLEWLECMCMRHGSILTVLEYRQEAQQ